MIAEPDASPPPAPTVFGVVHDADGAPVAGALVSTEFGQTRTAEDGTYRLAVPAAEVTLEFDGPGFLPGLRRISLGEGATWLNMRLLRAAMPQPRPSCEGRAAFRESFSKYTSVFAFAFEPSRQASHAA